MAALNGSVDSGSTALCRDYVAWSRRALLTPIEITWENLATYATYRRPVSNSPFAENHCYTAT